MSDRELLELAAKAAVISVEYRRGSDAFYYDDRETGREEWNPLCNDGQALRLAVKLGMQVCIGVRRIDATIVGDEDGHVFRGTVAKDGDLAAATRRAIVRAAAALAVSLPFQVSPKEKTE